MKKKAIALMLAMSMTVMFCACGASEDSSAETAREDSASGAEDTEDETAAEAVSEETEEETEGSEEVNEYGFTASQQEALVESVKNAVTTDFLEPYNISPSEFVLQPYDVNDFYDYRMFLDGIAVEYEYIGDDPYEISDKWFAIDTLIFSFTDIGTKISLLSVTYGDDTESMADEMESQLTDGTITIPPTMNYTPDTINSSEEGIALGNAIYKGVAEFLNSLDTRECAELLVNLGLKYYNLETVEFTLEDSNGTETSRVWFRSTTTIFDKVITENIQFE